MSSECSSFSAKYTQKTALACVLLFRVSSVTCGPECEFQLRLDSCCIWFCPYFPCIGIPLLLMLNILSQGLFKTGVFKDRKPCLLDAHGEHCLSIAVYNCWGSTMKKTHNCGFCELCKGCGN